MSRPRGGTITTTGAGVPSIFMAFVLITLGSIAMCIILKRIGVGRVRAALAALVVAGAPAVCVMVG